MNEKRLEFSWEEDSKEMTIINQGLGMSCKNYKVAQNFRVSLDEKTKGNFAERQNTVTPCKLIIS